MLEKRGLPFRVLEYEHDPRADAYGTEAAEALDLDPHAVFKTLLARLDGDELVVALVPVTTTLDLKALARAGGSKRAAMADPADAERATGYVVGGISPLGQKKRLRSFVDETVTLLDECFVSGGRRGMELALAPDDLVEALAAVIAPLGS
jgi:Cys-tRNA(Pro)/Cys-tRNA(Cys) deacylase